MKLLLLGATGRTGSHVLKKALAAGHQVNCLARNSTRINPQNQLQVFEGNPASKADLERAITGCEAVISVLNISRKADFPWSKLRTPEDYLSNVMSKLVPVAEEKGIKHLVVCSAWGVAETREDIPGWFRWFIDNSNIGVAYRDHERQEEIVSESALNWTIVRPVGLTNSGSREEIKESFRNKPKPGLLIARQSVANYLVENLQNSRLYRQKVVISKA